jgi:hypothetical protein
MGVGVGLVFVTDYATLLLILEEIGKKRDLRKCNHRPKSFLPSRGVLSR